MEPVDPRLSNKDGWGKSLDHIMPKSLGGGPEIENLRLAHRRCNSYRGNDPDTGPRPRAPRRRKHHRIPYSFYLAMFSLNGAMGKLSKQEHITFIAQPWRSKGGKTHDD
jgi:hypothetical protein